VARSLAARRGGNVSRLAAALRGLAHRLGSTVLILAVALVAVAAAATGPAYYAAAKSSILQDSLHSGGVFDRGIEGTGSGPLSSLAGTLQQQVGGQLLATFGLASEQRLFGQPLADLEGSGVFSLSQTTVAVDWRTDVCAHVQISGSCPEQAGQVMVSQGLAKVYSLRVGQKLDVSSWQALTVTGIYKPRNMSDDYWFGHAASYFPMEAGNQSASGIGTAENSLDALLVSQATMSAAPVTAQGTAVIDYPVVTGHVTAADVPRLQSGAQNLVNSTILQLDQVPVASNIPNAFASVEAAWRTILIPIWVITAQLLTVSWLLLFLAVTDAVDARGPEVALARLRGRRRLRTLAFALSEPTTLLLLALPLGVLASLATTTALASVLLRPGITVTVSAADWLAAAAVTAGGLIAVIVAAGRTLRRPVAEQWRRAGRQATDRGWVIDAILLTGALAGLAELAANGEIGSTSHSTLSLLVPGLLGLAVAVVASRVLPLACRAWFQQSSRRGGLSSYLAVRHIARRPGGVRTTIVLATAFALAAFAVTAWSVNRNNDRMVAYTRAGAPTVLSVAVPQGKDLGAIVDKADPGGTQAAVVDRYVSLSSGSSGTVTLGVDPQRFAHVAFWAKGFSAEPLQKLMAELAPSAPAPVTVSGSAMRVTVTASKLSLPGEQLWANLTVGSTPLFLGTLPTSGTVTLTASLTGCPCVLQNFYLQPAVLAQQLSHPVSGTLTFSGLAYQAPGATGWTSGRAGLFTSDGQWKAADPFTPADVVKASHSGLSWTFDSAGGRAGVDKAAPTLASVNHPDPMPALAPAAMIGGRGSLFQGVGLDGDPLTVRIVAPVAAIPSAPTNGFIMDRQYAELAANQDVIQGDQEVWLAAGAQGQIEPRLKAAGVRITSVTSAADAFSMLSRQGPALASSLFLADAAAAALLAVGAAILGLYLSARRRRYEYAALEASGVPRRRLRRAVGIELAVVLGFGTIVGIATGFAAAAIALRAVPEFATNPAAPPLSYMPSAGPLAALLGTAVGLLIVVSVVLSTTIIQGVRLEQLREAPA
jgi:putative ABC transport system permease protein